VIPLPAIFIHSFPKWMEIERRNFTKRGFGRIIETGKADFPALQAMILWERTAGQRLEPKRQKRGRKPDMRKWNISCVQAKFLLFLNEY